MAKKPKAPTGVRAAIPWRIRVREDDGFRPLAVSMEGKFLGGWFQSTTGWRRRRSRGSQSRCGKCTTR